MVYAKHLLSSWGSEILVSGRQRMPTWPAPNKNFGCCVSSGLPWAETLYRGCCLFKAGGVVSSVWPSWEAEIIKNLTRGSLQNPPVSFSLIIQLCILLDHYILRCHYSYTLNLISPFSKLLHLAGMAGGGSWRCPIPYTTEFIWVKPRLIVQSRCKWSDYTDLLVWISTNWIERNLCYLSFISPKLGMKIIYLIICYMSYLYIIYMSQL